MNTNKILILLLQKSIRVNQQPEEWNSESSGISNEW